jgi:hypothetical protein
MDSRVRAMPDMYVCVSRRGCRRCTHVRGVSGACMSSPWTCTEMPEITKVAVDSSDGGVGAPSPAGGTAVDVIVLVCDADAV